MKPFSTFTALQNTSVDCSVEDFKVKICIFCLSCTHRLTVYYFSRCECLFSPIFLHSRGGRCQPRMVLVMMLPLQRRALTLRLCQLWCVTTAWVAGSPQRESQGSEVSQMHPWPCLTSNTSSVTKLRNGLTVYRTSHNSFCRRRWAGSSISFTSEDPFWIVSLWYRFRTCVRFHHVSLSCYLLSPNEHEADCSRSWPWFTTLQSELQPCSQRCDWICSFLHIHGFACSDV